MGDSRTTASTVAAHDAKSNFGRLLDRVERGEAIVIVRHGRPVARLVPFHEPIDRERVDRAIEGLLELQRNRTLGTDLSIEDLINEGRDS